MEDPEKLVTHLRAICDAHNVILSSLVLHHPDRDTVIAHIRQLAGESEDLLLGTDTPDDVASLVRRYLESFVRDCEGPL